MKSIFRIPLLVVVVGGCATAGSTSDLPPEPLSWPAGRFALVGEVQYQPDTRRTAPTASAIIRAELVIGSDGSMRLEGSPGSCVDRSPSTVRRDQEHGQRTFPCGEMTFILKPAGETVTGEVWISTLGSLDSRRTMTRQRTQLRVERIEET